MKEAKKLIKNVEKLMTKDEKTYLKMEFDNFFYKILKKNKGDVVSTKEYIQYQTYIHKKELKMIKIGFDTYEGLERLKAKIEKRQPYLKGLLSPNVVIQMLLLKKKIKLSKYRYLEVEK